MLSRNSPEYPYMPNPKNKMETAMSSTNKAVISVAKSILDEAHIEFVIQANDGITNILVHGNDSFQARRLLHELEELDFEPNE